MTREEAILWLRQAHYDLQTARHLLEHGDWYAVAFWCHQVAEKALKALLIAYGKPVRTHNLLQLGRMIEEETAVRLPDDVKRCLRRLNPHYTIARYPDAANGLPYELYSREEAEEAIGCAERVLDWVKQYLH